MVVVRFEECGVVGDGGIGVCGFLFFIGLGGGVICEIVVCLVVVCGFGVVVIGDVVVVVVVFVCID